jgi:hypothetical protein
MKCPDCGALFDLNQPGDVLRCAYCGTTAQRPVATDGQAADPLASVMQLMEDRNHNGIPDAFEGLAPGTKASHKTVVQTVSTSYSFNGRTYTSLDEMPPDARSHFERGQRLTFSVSGRLSFQKALDSMRPGALPGATASPRARGSSVVLVLAVAIGILLLLVLVLAARIG